MSLRALSGPLSAAERRAALTRLPWALRADALEKEVLRVADATRLNTSSMLQDIRRNRPTEVDYMNGHLVALGRAHGLPAVALVEHVGEHLPHLPGLLRHQPLRRARRHVERGEQQAQHPLLGEVGRAHAAQPPGHLQPEPRLEVEHVPPARHARHLGRREHVVRDQLLGNRSRALQLGVLALGYWAFDALCLIVVFLALGVGFSPVELLVAYGIATAVGNLPLTPGGLGTFEATMLGTLALLGYGPEVAIPVLGYRLFNFWLPIPLAVLLYPTLGFGAGR